METWGKHLGGLKGRAADAVPGGIFYDVMPYFFDSASEHWLPSKEDARLAAERGILTEKDRENP